MSLRPSDPRVSWRGEGIDRAPVRIGPAGWVRVAGRGTAIGSMLAIGFPLLLLLRPVERTVWGASRPVTPWITQTVCRATCLVLGLRRRVRGRVMATPGAFLANHVSWLDIFVLNASARLYFVAKSEVHGWAGIGWLARGTGTLFVERRREAAKVQERAVAERLGAGHKLMIFPEGTSTDGMQVLPFKSTILAAFFTPGLPDDLSVQPVSLRYHAPDGREPRFYGWWGDRGIVPSLLEVLAQAPQGRVSVTWHEPVPEAEHDRKTLARMAEAQVRAGVADAEP